MSARTWIFRGLAVAGLGLAAFAGKLVVDAGAFRTIAPHFAGTSRTIPGIVGPEDLEYSAARSTLFISADHRPERPGEATPDGAIFAWSPDGPAAPTDLTTGWKPGFAFHPHGIASAELADRTRLFVINHREAETSIEIFTFKEGKLTFERSLRDPLLACANDVAAVDTERFYATHDHGTENLRLARLEDYTRIGRGYVTYFDRQRFTVKASGLTFANGAVFSAPPSDPHAKLLVASMLSRAILIYDRDPATANLTLSGRVALNGAPDNITRDEAGAIWVGAHPKMFALKAMNEDRRRRAPSLVLKVTGIKTATPSVEEVLMDDGARISAASVAWKLGNRLVVGSVFDDRLLDCTLAK